MLFGYLARDDGRPPRRRELRGRVAQWVVLGAITNALPFWLVAWGEKHVDSGIAAVAQVDGAALHVLLGLRFLPHEPLSRLQLLGSASVSSASRCSPGGGPAGGWWAVAGTLAVVLSSLAYAQRNRDGQRSVGSTPGPVLATGAMLAAALISCSRSPSSSARPTMPDQNAISLACSRSRSSVPRSPSSSSTG